jgi:predicted ATPase/class 3 adenylate cyclase/DNA-binding CsgD family transcriptional regulator
MPALGTIAFVLGDVEESTRHWERTPTEMSRWMGELNALVDELRDKFDGTRPVEQGEGDSFVVAFARAPDAVAFAMELQRQMRNAPLAVRVGVHAGDAQLQNGRYEGPTVIRAARLRDLGHGGQVLLSQAAADLAADALPEDGGVLSLGVYRLKGLERSEAVLQLTHPDLRAQFPTLRAGRVSGALPATASSFIGFANELGELQELVTSRRLVTIAGAGGCGKTRLAIETARAIAEEFAGGMAFCDLAPVGDGATVPQVLCTALGFRTTSHESDTDIACARLAEARALVVLDNCEHVIESAANLADALMRRCPHVVVLATSREPLGVDGEVTWRVPPLDADAAAELFADRARQVRPALALEGGAHDAVDEICQRVEGIPLAIELAAARTRVMAVEQIAESLRERFTLLGTGRRTSLARQQTLEASLGWSHDLLTEEQRVVYRRIGAFAGGFTFAEAQPVVAGDGIAESDVLDLLTQLVDRSLLEADGARFRMLEVMRHDARERLLASGEARAVFARHLAAYVDWATSLGDGVRSAHKPYAVALGELDAEFGNIRAAVEWALHERDALSGLQIVNVLWTLWFRIRTGARIKEARGWLDELLAIGEDLPPRVRCTALVALTYSTETLVYDWADGEAWGYEALQIALDLGDEALAAQAALFLGLAQGNLGKNESLESLARGVELGRSSGDWISTGLALRETVFQHLFRGQIPEAIAAGRAALAVIPSNAGAAPIAATVRTVLGWAEASAGNSAEGDRLVREALTVLDAAGDLYQGATAWLGCGWLALLRGDADAAGEFFRTAFARASESGIQVTTALTAANVARSHVLLGDYDAFEVAAAHAQAFYDTVRGRLVPIFAADLTRLRGIVAWRQGDLESARTLARAAMLDDMELAMLGAAQTLVFGALVERECGDAGEAEARVADALVYIQRGSWALAPESLTMSAILRADAGADADAVRLLAAADAGRNAMGTGRDPEVSLPADETIGALRERMEDATFAAAWEAGAALSVQEAVAFALRGRGPRRRPSTGWNSLTPTEIRVAELVADGWTNKQIGERLLMSPRTVSTHLSHVFAKLGIARRAELAGLVKTR